ncbi:MAG: LamG-like jellyroll fold domain-containing protein [Candidatus Cyclobacteriaceae bacterium M3_2C_046]
MRYLNLFLIITILNISCKSTDKHPDQLTPVDIDDLVTFWDFQENQDGETDLTSKGPFAYTLTEMNGPIAQAKEGIFGPSGLEIERGQWLRIKREDCPALANIHGEQEVSIVAWIKRKADVHWQYIAGVWKEGAKEYKGQAKGSGEGAPGRQYALFTCGHKQVDYTTLTRTDAEHQVHGYVSDVGGATPERPFSFSYATGKSKLDFDEWNMIAFTYDHEAIRVYFNGELDKNGNYNPFYWDQPIFDGGEDGGDFTIAQREVPSWPDYPEGQPGNKVGFGGVLGGLAVYNRALGPSEIQQLYQSTMKNKKEQP